MPSAEGCSTALHRSIQLHQAPHKRNRMTRCLSHPRGLVHCVHVHPGITGAPASPGPQGWQSPRRGSGVSPAHAASPTGSALAVQHPAPRCPGPRPAGRSPCPLQKPPSTIRDRCCLQFLFYFFNIGTHETISQGLDFPAELCRRALNN